MKVEIAADFTTNEVTIIARHTLTRAQREKIGTAGVTYEQLARVLETRFDFVVRDMTERQDMTPREKAYNAINSERAYQAARYPRQSLTIGEYLLLVREYISRATRVWATNKNDAERMLHVMRKIAGIAVACLEQHGAPMRTEAEIENARWRAQHGGS